MGRKVIRVAKPLGWITLGWTLGALWILGPRVAMNRGLDYGYSVAGWFGSFFS